MEIIIFFNKKIIENDIKVKSIVNILDIVVRYHLTNLKIVFVRYEK